MCGGGLSAIRVFVAVEPPLAVREELWRIMALWRAQWRLIRWESVAKLHFTLRFLGEIKEEEMGTVCRAAGTVAARCEPFLLELGGVGCYPSSRNPRVVWVGTVRGGERLAVLQGLLEDELSAAGFGRDSRAFSPHLTVGRIRGALSGPRLAGLAVQPIEFPVERLEVKQSTLAPGGSLYTDRGSYPLGGQTRKE